MTDFPLIYLSVGLDSLKLFLTMTWEFKSARDHTAGIARLKKIRDKLNAVGLKKSVTAGDFSHCLPQYSSSCTGETLLIYFPRWEKFPGLFPLLSVYHPRSQSRILLWFGSPLHLDNMIASRNMFWYVRHAFTCTNSTKQL